MCPPSSTGNGSMFNKRQVHVENDAEPQHAPPAVLVLKKVAVNTDDHHRAAKLLHADFALLLKQRAEGVENLHRADF